MNRVYARCRQFIFSKFLALLPEQKQNLIQGRGSILQIPDLLVKEDVDRVLLVTTAGFVKRGSLLPLMEKLENSNIKYCVYSEVLPDPTTECIEMAVDSYIQGKCQAIIAVGGGSVMDCSKVVAARIARPNKTISQLAGVLKVHSKVPAIFAVPTTAGTGSEVTAGAVVTDTKNQLKFTVLDTCLVPKYAILDANLTLSLPASITAVTGMDALTHAVEAYTNRFASDKAKKCAVDAVKLIHDNLLLAYEDGGNVEARENLLLASYYAGFAITNAYIGYVHALAHAIGGMYHVTHGLANAIILPKVLTWYGSSCQKDVAMLASAIHLEGNNDEELTSAFIDFILEFNDKLGIDRELHVVKEEDISELARRADREANPLYPVPRLWSRREFEEAFRAFV